MVVRPYPPSEQYPLGSDTEARDLLSRLIYGTRNTLGIAISAALVRISLGIFLGWLAARVSELRRRIIFALTNLSAALPGLLFAFVIIATIGPDRGDIIFVIGIGLAGWASWAQLAYSGIQRIDAEPYMEAALGYWRNNEKQNPALLPAQPAAGSATDRGSRDRGHLAHSGGTGFHWFISGQS